MTWQTKMMDIAYYAEEKGREEGREEGMEKGMKALVCSLKGLSLDREVVAAQLAEQYGLPMQTALDKVDQYWMTE